jgi:hypothetical protein
MRAAQQRPSRGRRQAGLLKKKQLIYGQDTMGTCSRLRHLRKKALRAGSLASLEDYARKAKVYTPGDKVYPPGDLMMIRQHVVRLMDAKARRRGCDGGDDVRSLTDTFTDASTLRHMVYDAVMNRADSSVGDVILSRRAVRDFVLRLRDQMRDLLDAVAPSHTTKHMTTIDRLIQHILTSTPIDDGDLESLRPVSVSAATTNVETSSAHRRRIISLLETLTLTGSSSIAYFLERHAGGDDMSTTDAAILFFEDLVQAVGTVRRTLIESLDIKCSVWTRAGKRFKDWKEAVASLSESECSRIRQDAVRLDTVVDQAATMISHMVVLDPRLREAQAELMSMKRAPVAPRPR